MNVPALLALGAGVYYLNEKPEIIRRFLGIPDEGLVAHDNTDVLQHLTSITTSLSALGNDLRRIDDDVAATIQPQLSEIAADIEAQYNPSANLQQLLADLDGLQNQVGDVRSVDVTALAAAQANLTALLTTLSQQFALAHPDEDGDGDPDPHTDTKPAPDPPTPLLSQSFTFAVPAASELVPGDPNDANDRDKIQLLYNEQTLGQIDVDPSVEPRFDGRVAMRCTFIVTSIALDESTLYPADGEFNEFDNPPDINDSWLYGDVYRQGATMLASVSLGASYDLHAQIALNEDLIYTSRWNATHPNIRELWTQYRSMRDEFTLVALVPAVDLNHDGTLDIKLRTRAGANVQGTLLLELLDESDV